MLLLAAPALAVNVTAGYGRRTCVLASIDSLLLLF